MVVTHSIMTHNHFPFQDSRLRYVLEACVSQVSMATNTIDLFGGTLSSNVQRGCPGCLVTTSFTLSGNDSFIEFRTEEETTSFITLLLEFQTRYII